MYKSRTVERNMFYGASPEIFKRAKELRECMTESELLLLHELKSKNLKEFKFRPQHPVSHFIADFYSHQLKLVIEVDGGIHDEIYQQERDQGRNYEMEELGITVLRFTIEEINNNLSDVLSRINTVITQLQKQIQTQ